MINRMQDIFLYGYNSFFNSIITVNRINPEKLLLSKWSAVKPVRKERHFIVTRLLRDSTGRIIACELEAVINNNLYQFDWHELENTKRWITGWK